MIFFAFDGRSHIPSRASGVRFRDSGACRIGTSSISANVMFVPVYKNIPTNVIGGIGFISGFGSTIYTFTTFESQTYRYYRPFVK